MQKEAMIKRQKKCIGMWQQCPSAVSVDQMAISAQENRQIQIMNTNQKQAKSVVRNFSLNEYSVTDLKVSILQQKCL